LTIPSIAGPATAVPISEATKDDKLVAPTDRTEKLYGGAEKIWEIVMEIPTNQEIHVVKSRVAHSTAGDARRRNGRTMVESNETWLT